MGANPSLFSCIRGLNYLRILVGDCVCWGWSVGVGMIDVCVQVHATIEAFSLFFSSLFQSKCAL